MRWSACSLPTYLTPKSSTTREKVTGLDSCFQRVGCGALMEHSQRWRGVLGGGRWQCVQLV